MRKGVLIDIRNAMAEAAGAWVGVKNTKSKLSAGVSGLWRANQDIPHPCSGLFRGRLLRTSGGLEEATKILLLSMTDAA